MNLNAFIAAVTIGGALATLPILATAKADDPAASPVPALGMSRANTQTPEGGCIYSLAGTWDVLCEDTEEIFCKKHMGGFVTARFYPGELCASLRQRGLF